MSRLLCTVLAVLISVTGSTAPARPQATQAKRIAFIVDSWYPHSHADVIGTRLLEGYRIGGQHRKPHVTVASIFADSPRPTDRTRDVAAKYGIRAARSVAEALLDDPRSSSPQLAVDGVFLATDDTLPRSGQTPSPSPRLRAFREIVRILDLAGARVPIFIDKMLAANWQDSLIMVAEAKRRGIPLMGGSVLSYMPLDRPVAVSGKVEVGVVIAAGPYWAYAFHAMELLQSFMERRADVETGIGGIREVGPGFWSLPDRDQWGAGLLDTMLASSTTRRGGKWNPAEADREIRIVLLQYADGSRGVLALLPRAFAESEFVVGLRTGNGTGIGGLRLQGPPFDHFGFLVQALVEFYSTGQAVVPIEHTLLSTGAVLHGQPGPTQGHISTPSMTFTYTPKR